MSKRLFFFSLIFASAFCTVPLLGQNLSSFTFAPHELTRTINLSSSDSVASHFDNSGSFLFIYNRLFRQTGESKNTVNKLLQANLNLLPVVSGSVYNNKLPYSINSGPSWTGRGYSSSISGGINLRWLIFDIQVAPTYIISQNRNITLPEDIYETDISKIYYEPYRYYDRPALIDSGTVSRTYLGESWVKLSLGPISAGISNQNLWWGPGRRSSILMSNNAPGFHHATIHTNRPVNIGLGNIQFEYIAGRLEKSYYNIRPVRDYNDWRFLTALVVDFEPRITPGLHVGLIRAFHLRQRDLKERKDYFPLFQPFQKKKLPREGGLGDGTSPDDQRASVYFNWFFEEIKLHFYGEFARTDHASDIRDFLLEPNHARAYMIGFNKRFETKDFNVWSVSAEITDISNTTPSRVRLWREGQPPQDLFFYIHVAGLHHGYNHRGREIGSHYGMGSTGWFLSLQRRSSKNDMGLMAEFVRRNRVTYLAYADEFGEPARQQLDMTLGGYFRIPVQSGLADIKLDVYTTQIQNQYYMPIIGVDGRENYRNIQNWNISITLRINMDQLSFR